MTCGSKKHITEALAKIKVKEIEDPQYQHLLKPDTKLKRDKLLALE